MMNVKPSVYQGVSKLPNNEMNMMSCNSTINFVTQCTIDKSPTNHLQNNRKVCVDESDQIFPSEYYPFVNDMDDNSACDTNLHETIQRHKKSSSSGFNSLQKRLEKVKNDLKTLTSKLYVDDINENKNGTNRTVYCESSDSDVPDNGANIQKEEKRQVTFDIEKTSNVPSQSTTKNPYSELSENTQKILERLHSKEVNKIESIDDEDMQVEMEEDEIEFTFSTRSNSLLDTLLLRDQMPIIEEEDEEESISDESDSISTDLISINNDEMSTHKSNSLHSFDISDSGSYATARSNCDTKIEQHKSIENTEEYFSDFAKCSVSTGSSQESLVSQDSEKSKNTYCEAAVKSENYLNKNENAEKSENLDEKISEFFKVDDELASEAEYDTSIWSTDDIIQSIDRSDSFYENQYHPTVKSSLPDLLESCCSLPFDNGAGKLIMKHFNKSTDLDELFAQLPAHSEPQAGRLSQSMCDLVPSRPNKFERTNSVYDDLSSPDNLLETDLDSGYVSIYKPSVQSCVSPTVKVSKSLINVSPAKCQVPLITKLKNKAGSSTELRIAESLTKLNIPAWLKLPNTDDYDDRAKDNLKKSTIEDLNNNRHSLFIQNYSLPLEKPTQRRETTRPYLKIENRTLPVIQSKPSSHVILPSEVLRQNSQRKLSPIIVCQARQLLLPNKITINNLNSPIKL